MSNYRAHLDLTREFARENLKGLVLEVQALSAGGDRGPLLDQMIELLADFGHVRFALAYDIVRDAAFEHVLSHRL